MNKEKVELPIIHLWYKYILLSNDILEKTPQRVKFTYVDRIINANITAMGNLLSAKYSKPADKENILKETQIEIEKIRMMYRILYDTKAITFQHYEQILELLLTSGKMCNGWRISCSQQ